MPVSPEVGSRFAAPVVDLLTAYELALMESAAATLRGDQSRPEWATTALARITQWRRAAEAGVPGALRELADAVRVALAGAAEAGATEALVDLPGLPSVPPAGVPGVTLAVARLGEQLAAALQQTPRLMEVVLREAVAAGVADVRAGTATRRQGSQQVLDRLVRQGVTGYRDSAGRNWSLTSYTEMAVRTETQAAALDAGETRIRDLGLDSVLVSDSPRECPLCRPFEGKVLKLDGAGPGTLAHARAQGFQHPNCTHAFSGYIPGVSKPGEATANPDGYEEKQHQRYLERKVREWKRMEAVSLDPARQAVARAKVREWQTQLRDYVKANGLKRQPGRESITKAV